MMNEIKKMYSPFLVSVVHLAYFVVLRGFQAFVAAFYRVSQGWTLLFQKTWISPKFESAWKNLQTFRSNFRPTDRSRVTNATFQMGEQ